MQGNRPERTLQIQSVIFENEKNHLLRSMESTYQAASYALEQGTFSRIHLSLGDGSSHPVFREEEIRELNSAYGGKMEISYRFWGQNYGTAKGHNILAENCDGGYLLVEHPDIVMCCDTISLLYEPFRVLPDKAGMSEAKQLPIEYPKYYNPQTGETCWSSTVCTMFSKHVFDLVHGFDADSFFLYCDDVDFSWRVRLKGYQIIYQPAAAVYHDKSLSRAEKWQMTSAKRYYSAEAGLLLAYKWSRNDLVRKILADFKRSPESYFQRAAEDFEQRKTEDRLPEQLDRHHRVAEFVDGYYGKMRFAL